MSKGHSCYTNYGDLYREDPNNVVVKCDYNILHDSELQYIGFISKAKPTFTCTAEIVHK